ncbi:response regulator transcription factor [Acidaminobacter sp. JC074]|uniref:response regulator transcription factor n=1 Tax=Acidaminobacter sp. JC074 TaxID=2530199 RepID=UPI001F1029E3|nr:response regulator transcription factor [Acidaminobacter sp. JC074]MCH4887179.1 response regulator transcription factor [Acidaminobacter sp. JC074]
MRIIIAEDDALIRESLTMMFGMYDDIELLGTFENGKEAYDFLKGNQVDLLLTDIRMPVMDGVELTKKVEDMNVKVLVLTTFTDHEYIYECITHGADGYILKSRGIKEIYKSIQSVMAGQVVFDTTVKSALLKKPIAKERDECVSLTPKEFSILKCIGSGLNNKEISGELFLSEGTIRNYISQLLDKLDLRDRTQLAIYYVKYYE